MGASIGCYHNTLVALFSLRRSLCMPWITCTLFGQNILITIQKTLVIQEQYVEVNYSYCMKWPTNKSLYEVSSAMKSSWNPVWWKCFHCNKIVHNALSVHNRRGKGEMKKVERKALIEEGERGRQGKEYHTNAYQFSNAESSELAIKLHHVASVSKG